MTAVNLVPVTYPSTNHLLNHLHMLRSILRFIISAVCTVLSVPFDLSRGHELIRDDLSAVAEVAKLCLPNGESVGVLHRVTKLITHG